MSDSSLEFVESEIALIENKHLEFFKSQPSISPGNNYLRLKDCITFTLIHIPPKQERMPGIRYQNFRIGEKITLPNEIIKDLTEEVGKKFSQL